MTRGHRVSIGTVRALKKQGQSRTNWSRLLMQKETDVEKQEMQDRFDPDGGSKA